MKLKKGDLVKIVLGKDRGKSGKIEKVLPKLKKVLVQGVNLYKRHLKAKAAGQSSEIVTITKPMSSQSVALICPHCKLQTRIGYRIEKNDKSSTESVRDKIRVCRKCDKKI
ncbi:MAG: 50S ribosomal protein L24 [Candidatus Levybacteria bacterium RIFCSPLOWO2_01_FULL_39_24]|nr:MAG: 50S ribosomal protein L24 [Candidatus Levybacteria bacterium RIFCSPHIGHO2_01_FULL_40_16]OGH28556.1 MAG: 50S ribosomal protein L24 [Candidatus Levybacteria bacterium RIFCSPHIGHO2_12_FULL_39_9]OGH45944.1 MAG: 50S ribosomal protein L24 [Candidatus Levybacteria bacterium RIFCSPLOWO2_01_FULL_39_24]